MRRARGGPSAVWLLGFRPFFLAASLWSAIALALWAAMLSTGWALPSRFDPLAWHIHEMLFGFVPAAIAGFMLTAIAAWTGRSPVCGRPLAGLAALWLLGRLACLGSALMPLWASATVDLAFPFALCAVVSREIVAGHNWRNAPMPVPIAVLGVADVLMYLQVAGFAVPPDLGWRLGLAAIMVLVSVVGERIVPAFTHNWLAQRGLGGVPAVRGVIRRLALGTLHASLVGWAFLPTYRPVGVVLLVAAALTLFRLLRWRGVATLAEPLLVILHVGYGWVAVGAALLGASMVSPAVSEMAAIHVLTAGAIGTLVLAVMTRVSLGHTGRPLHASRVTALIYVLVNLAAIVRIVAEFTSTAFLPLILASAALWMASFVLFAIHYGPMLTSPRIE